MSVRAGHFFGGRVGRHFRWSGDASEPARGCGICGEVLIAGAIADVENDAPDEVGGEAAEQDDDEHGQSVPEDGGAVAQRLSALMGSPAARPKAKQALITPENVATSESFFQIELLDRGALLFFGHFALFRSMPASAGDDDAEQADADTDEDHRRRSECRELRWRTGREKIGGISVPNAAQ